MSSDTKSSARSTASRSRSRARSEGEAAASSRHGAPAGTNAANITRVSRESARRGKTDWAAVDALGDAGIVEAARSDPDAVPFDFDWSGATIVVPGRKRPISIRLDEDVLDFFKRQGAGYQRRINAVLRSYVESAGRKRD